MRLSKPRRSKQSSQAPVICDVRMVAATQYIDFGRVIPASKAMLANTIRDRYGRVWS